MVDALAFVVTFHGRRYLARSKPQDKIVDPRVPTGWRPFRWVQDLIDAEKWADAQSARSFAEKSLPGGYEIRPIYGASPRSVA